YVDILEIVMLPSARTRFPVDQYPTITFVQDNSAVHNAHVEIRIAQNSRCINPACKRCMEQLLRDRPEICQHISQSMRTRLQQIIDNNGYWINY
ncbi:hypothetical protein ALC57_14805, partial [Trachymyrmex cornetzi]